MVIYTVLQYLVFVLLSFAVLYILFFAIAGLFYKQEKFNKAEKFRKIAVLIPGYKEDAVIIGVAQSALQQRYPMLAFDVVVIADSFKKSTIDKLKILPVKLIEVSFEKSTKSKALNKAMSQLKSAYDIAVVLDADNIMAPDFLYKINDAFELGYKAVQGHRTAKNLNNTWAILDAISEEINNNIFRKGHRAIGLSSAIIGSGMAFQYNFFKNLMSSIDAVGGFDKEIELKILKQGIKIAYIDDAFVYDEKVQEAAVFGNQRRRWLSAQLYYFKFGFFDALKNLFLKGNIDYFDKAIQFILPPRVLLLAAVILLGCIFITTNLLLNIYVQNIFWILIITTNVFSLLISIPRKFYNKKTMKAIMNLPKGIFVMLRSLLKIKGANKEFIHTKHQSTTIKTSF